MSSSVSFSSTSPLQALGNWLKLKQYQFEVTFGVYIFTPIEKFVFWSIVFLVTSLALIATVLYLPQHIIFLIHRAWFYYNGDDSGFNKVLGGLAKATANMIVTSDAASETVESIVREL